MDDVLCCPPRLSISISKDHEPIPAFDDAQHLAGLRATRWGGDGADATDREENKVRELHVRFMEPFDPLVAFRVQSIIEGAWGWNQACGMQFIFDQSPDAEIRVSFIKGDGSWSFLGTQALAVPQDRPTMNFGWLYPNTSLVEYHRVVLHEFGHALGFVHEHQSPYLDIPWDYDKVYAYYRKKDGWGKQTVDNNVLRRYSANEVDATEGDPKSIMCYLIDPIFLTDTTLVIGGNSDLSELDTKKAREWYGAPPANSVNMYLPVVGG